MPAWRPRPAASFSNAVGPRAARSSRPDPRSVTTGHSLYRFRKENRLLDAHGYARVFEKATSSRDRWFTVLWRENRQGGARLGLAIAKKHCRLAVGRNRIKRIVRESFRIHRDGLPGLDIVVINRPPAATAGNRQLFDSLAGHWKRCRSGRNDTAGQGVAAGREQENG